MNDIDVLWDALSGWLQSCVQNYQLKEADSKIKPSFEVDYEIPESIMDRIERSYKGSSDNVWYLRFMSCRNVNNLPDYLQELVKMFLPSFLERYPNYKEEECLRFME